MEEARRILRDIFGYDDFRPNQAEIVRTLVEGGDALVLMPTGGGKSLCYQIPAIARPGCGVVISPLIALMQDQVEALRQLGVRAAFLNSTLEREEERKVERALLAGELELLYIAPERLLAERTLELLERAALALFAIDEAHCVSQWGHDFRPEYRRLEILHRRFPRVPRIALTATADARTRSEIVEQLDLRKARHFISSFDRPNIRYAITDGGNARERLWRFLQREHPHDAGIVYCLSRKKVEETARWLRARGRQALPYHAGMSAREREANQQRFLREDGIVMVATIAFGMGIDKPDVRFVAHLNLPKSIEAYYQETGRAGRDGLPADAWMAYGLQDVILLRRMAEESEADEHHKRITRHKLEAMLGLCETTSCRRQALLGYFGENLEAPCGNCDNCLRPPTTWEATEAAQKALSCVWRTGQRFGVNHLIDVLLGKESERIRRFGHHRLSTFGIGGELKAGEWRSLYRQLIALGYLEVDHDGYGALKLTEGCRPLLRGEERLELRKPRRIERKRTAKAAAAPEFDARDSALFEALRSLRLKLAKEQGVPPYVIFHDSTLKEMVVAQPRTLEEMGGIGGVGVQKLERYGKAFLEAIQRQIPAEIA